MWGNALAAKWGYRTRDEAWIIGVIGGSIGVLTGIEIGMLQARLVEYGYFSPYVAVTAIVAARFCIRAGLLTALLSVLLWDFCISPSKYPGVSDLMAFASAFVVAVAVAPRDEKTPKDPPRHTRGMPMPFTRPADKSGNGHIDASFWGVTPSQVWAEDDWCGRQYGSIYVSELQNAGRRDCPPLSWIVRDMVRAGRFGGLEAGFIHKIESAAARPDVDLQEVQEFVPLADDHPDHRRFH